MKGYKAFDANLQCRGFQYEVGKTYELEGELAICKNGYHFCETISDCYYYYPIGNGTRICKVEALGRIVRRDNKICTDKIRVVEEVTDIDLVKCNTGDYNSGNRNSGDYNSGNYNSGNYNSEDYNSGNYNSGNYNSGNYSSGCFNTEKHPRIIMFNKQSEWTYCDWRKSKAFGILRGYPMAKAVWVDANEMTNDEKAAHPEYETMGGILAKRKGTVTPQEWWDGLDESDKEEVMSLPNFDADIFKEIMGINVRNDYRTEDN